jgi:Na+/phosphate symporter
MTDNRDVRLTPALLAGVAITIGNRDLTLTVLTNEIFDMFVVFSSWTALSQAYKRLAQSGTFIWVLTSLSAASVIAAFLVATLHFVLITFFNFKP